MPPRPTSRTRAMTLVEVVIAMAVLGLVLVSLLQGASISLQMQRSTSEQTTGEILARELLDSVCALPYEEPGGAAALGLDAGEIVADRTSFDDIDDFHGWSETPPQRPDGTAMPGVAAWSRDVTVEAVKPADPTVTTLPGADEGAKLVVVRALRGGKLIAELERVRFRAADEVKQ